MSRRAGYTLVEMSIVILLIAIAASFVTPRIMPIISGQRSESFRQDSISLIREARERAITSGRSVAVVVGDSLRAEFDDDNSGDEEGEGGGGAAIRSRSLPEGTSLSDVWLEGEATDQSSFRLVFYPSGDATPAVIQFDQNGRLWHILVEGGTGRATLREGEYVEEGETKWTAGDLEIRTNAPPEE